MSENLEMESQTKDVEFGEKQYEQKIKYNEKNADRNFLKPSKEPQIPVFVYNWGPCVIKTKIKDNFMQMLQEQVKKNHKDYSHKLAGQLKTQIGFDQKSKDIISPELAKYLGAYDQMYQRYQNKPYEKKPRYALTSLWCNYQHAGDFQPPHDHDGALSFVIYLDIPQTLIDENKAYRATGGRSMGPGAISFHYGEGNRQSITNMSEFPSTGDMFIFPAWLKHWVFPFKSDSVRISMSGNIHSHVNINMLKENVKVVMDDGE
tara:strand:+ start:4157 stop:4939 length:783 start_codon:yes stop_codon:yes gene_type:complete